MRECFERFQMNAMPAVPVVSMARGERVAGGGIVAACAVQLGSVPASYAAVAANRRGSTPVFFVFKQGPGGGGEERASSISGEGQGMVNVSAAGM
jgi:hypothetical protein